MFRRDNNTRLYKRALGVFAEGVHVFEGGYDLTGTKPVYFRKAQGSKITSVNHKSYIDFINAWGANILGHSSPVILKAMANELSKGTGFGLNSRIKVEFAELICNLVPGAQKIKFLNSRTEAAMLAVRMARAYTGKNMIIKLEGGFHGFAGSLMVNNSSGESENKIIKLPGIPELTGDYTSMAAYNKIGSIQALFQKHKKNIAAVIVEPVASKMGCIITDQSFLEEIKLMCDKNGTLLIIDDSNTCFRLSLGGIQAYFGIHGDLIILGNLIGGGFPIAAVAGKNEIFELLSKDGNSYHNDLSSVNTVMLSAGYAMVKYLKDNKSIYKNLEEKTKHLVSGIKEIMALGNVPVQINHEGSMFSVIFSEKEVKDAEAVKGSNINHYKSFYKNLLKNGILFSPSPFLANYMSNAITEREIRKTLRAVKKWKKK